jgi:hypothetical protein
MMVIFVIWISLIGQVFCESIFCHSEINYDGTMVINSNQLENEK